MPLKKQINLYSGIMENNKYIQIGFAVGYNLILSFLIFFSENDNSPEDGYMILLKVSVFCIIAGVAFVIMRDKFPYTFSVNQKRILLITSTPLLLIIILNLLLFLSPVFQFWSNR